MLGAGARPRHRRVPVRDVVGFVRPRRETRRSDVAFWLHLLAAPMIVHPIFSLLGLTDGDASIGEALVVLAVYVLLGITALAIDRRALLVSALAYVLFALISLFREFGAVELNIALAAFVIGSGLLLLSAFWHGVRRSVVKPLPPGLQARLPVLDRVAPVAVRPERNARPFRPLPLHGRGFFFSAGPRLAFGRAPSELVRERIAVRRELERPELMQ